MLRQRGHLVGCALAARASSTGAGRRLVGGLAGATAAATAATATAAAATTAALFGGLLVGGRQERSLGVGLRTSHLGLGGLGLCLGPTRELLAGQRHEAGSRWLADLDRLDGLFGCLGLGSGC